MRTNPQPRLLALIIIAAWFASWFPTVLSAPSGEEARVTRVKGLVQLLRPMVASCPASVNDVVDDGTIVRTGPSSRVELTFSDETVVRLVGKTTFTFKNGTRDLNLGEGAALIQVPKTASGAEIHAADDAAVITGTTAMIEYHPGVCKFLVLEGTGRLYRPGHLGDSIVVNPGQLVIGNPNAAVSDPVDFDIARFVKTSRFITDFRPLSTEKLILAESQKQQRKKSKKSLIETNLVIFGGGTRVSLVGQAPAATHPAANQSPEAARASQ